MALKATKISTAAADNIRIMKGKYVTSADGDGDYIAFELPKYCYLSHVSVDIKTAYTAASTGTITVGIKEPGIAISPARVADDTVILSEVTGVKGISTGIYLEKGGVLTVGILKGNSAADAVVRLFAVFSVIH
jgi:hypothetical protein